MRTLTALILSVALACAAPFATASTAAGARTVEGGVNGLVCSFCVQGINKQLRKFPATQDVLVSLEHGLVAVQVAAGKSLGDEQIRKALVDAGYTVTSIQRTTTPLAELRVRLAKK